MSATFYAPEAEAADMVQCRAGHEMTREVALAFGRLSYSRWGCPYCLYPDANQRQDVIRAYWQGVKDGRRERAA